MHRAVVVLLAGPSGSGKSRAARLSSSPQLALDDFYLDADHPGGLALYHAEPAVRARALALGCHPVSLREALRVVEQTMHTRSS